MWGEGNLGARPNPPCSASNCAAERGDGGVEGVAPERTNSGAVVRRRGEAGVEHAGQVARGGENVVAARRPRLRHCGGEIDDARASVFAARWQVGADEERRGGRAW